MTSSLALRAILRKRKAAKPAGKPIPAKPAAQRAATAGKPGHVEPATQRSGSEPVSHDRAATTRPATKETPAQIRRNPDAHDWAASVHRICGSTLPVHRGTAGWAASVSRVCGSTKDGKAPEDVVAQNHRGKSGWTASVARVCGSFIDTGRGHLGWAGSVKRVVRENGETTQLATKAFAPSRQHDPNDPHGWTASVARICGNRVET